MSLRSNRPDRAAATALLASTAREYLAARLTLAKSATATTLTQVMLPPLCGRLDPSSIRVDVQGSGPGADVDVARIEISDGGTSTPSLPMSEGELRRLLEAAVDALPAEFRDAIVITDFAGFLAQAFGGDKEARDGLGAMVGIDLGSVEGMGTPKGTSFDLAITSEEGKFPINCGGGYNPNKEAQRSLYMLLDSLVRPPRFDRLFQVPDRDGVVINREDVPTNIIDWTDVDVSRYSPVGAGSASEETYDKGRDRYEPHNQYFDTIEEMIQVRGVSEDLWAYFGDFFTVYGTQDCKVLASAMEPTAWPLLAARLVRMSTASSRSSGEPVAICSRNAFIPSWLSPTPSSPNPKNADWTAWGTSGLLTFGE